MARATTRIAITSDSAAWVTIVTWAHLRTGRGSGGLNAVEWVNARYRWSGYAGRHPAGASSGVAFSGKAKLGAIGEPAARSAGPPRSNCQYHRLNTITFSTQMAAPRPSNTVAVTPLTARGRSEAKTITPTMVPMVMTTSSATIRRRRVVERRLIRPGSWAMRSASRSSCSRGPSHHPGTRPRCGMPAYRIVAASTAVAIGQRGSAAGTGGPGAAVSPPALVASLMGCAPPPWLGGWSGSARPHADAPCANLDRDADRERRDPHELADQHDTPDAEDHRTRAGASQAGAAIAEEQRRRPGPGWRSASRPCRPPRRWSGWRTPRR